MKKTIIKYGAFGAIAICVLFLLSWYVMDDLSFASQEVLGYASMIIALLFVFFGIKHYRDNENNGKVAFKKALTIGVLISLITAVVFGILDVIYTEVLNPTFMDDYYNASVEQMKVSMSPEEFKVKLAELESQKELFTNPLFSFGLMTMTVFVIGFIISLISSLILQRK
ncbi:DUF4199 domain-containing protein [Croceivirga thetidis]|uniref:DUF4199 domain-containing protein n=1 Tax=Croceivirga thetidis TaxID=2721623 RepID=A0ABX1GLP3_9FLAO|nr:DUF4199 domain-containing protein [Croceivirga thetidis]NKI30830.1 DUF4199 domain-containing protein [Croceivirga thetidis]